MANIASAFRTFSGTEASDTLVGLQGANGAGQTINALSGDDVVIGDSAIVYQRSEPGGDNFATAILITDNPEFWSTFENPDFGDASIPHTTVLATGTGADQFYRLEVGAGETLTIDIDYGDGLQGSFGNFIGSMQIFDQNQQLIPGLDFSGVSDGGRGSVPTGFDPAISHDPYRTITNTSDQTVTYYVNVRGNGEPVQPERTYVMNVSLTGQAVSNATPGPDTIDGGGGDDVLYGGGGDDVLIGGRGIDTIFGGAGEDIFEYRNADFFSGGAVETWVGGAGNDTIRYIGTLSAPGTGAFMGLNTFDISGISALEFSGIGAMNLTVDAAQLGVLQRLDADAHTGLASRVTIQMEDQTAFRLDSVGINGFTDPEDSVTVTGDDDGETISSLFQAFSAFGNGGADSLTGSPADDTLDGGDDNDTLSGRAGNDRLTGGAGDDTITTGLGQDTVALQSGGGNDIVTDFDYANDSFDMSALSAADRDGMTITANDQGDRVMSFADGTSVTLQGVARNAPPIGAPQIAGTPRQGEVLTADLSALSDPDGFDPSGVAFQWLRNGTDIAGATSQSYSLTQDDVGATLSLRASYTDLFGSAESATSDATAQIVNVNDAPTGAVAIVGAPRVGEVLSIAGRDTIADADGLGGLRYQWLRDGAEIPGAEGEFYSVGETDIGATLTVQVRYTDGGGTFEVLEAAQTDPVTGLNLILTGTPDADRLEGGAGDDSIAGLDGPDTLLGNAGNDTLIGGATAADRSDVIFGGDGDDLIEGGHGNDRLRGDAGNDTIAGGFGGDTVIGGTGDDALTGSALGDLLFGGDGADFINGGFGYDRVNGGRGADDFFHLGIFDHGSDWIQDYSAADGDTLVFGNTAATRAQFQINLAQTPNAGDANVAEAFIIYRPTDQIIWALVDGGGQDQINLRIGGETFDLTA